MMNKETYLAELARHLKKLPKDDFQNAMAYYTEYFEEAGVENEAQVIEELGDPKEVAAELVHELLLGTSETTEKAPQNRSPWAIFGITVAALLLSPLGFAGLVFGLSMIFAALCVILAIVISTVAIEFGLIMQGVQSVIHGIGMFAQSMSVGCLFTGSGFLSIGIAVLIAILCFYLCKFIILGLSKVITHITQKRGV